jgi:UDP-glucose 4-epimerase
VKTFLITGGAGFIGRHLASALLLQGYRVRIVDDPSQESSAILPSSVEMWPGDVTDRQSINAALQGAQGVFHLAARMTNGEAMMDKARRMLTNIGGTEKVLAAARALSLPVVIASTSKVYPRAHGAGARLDESAILSKAQGYPNDKIAAEVQGRIMRSLYGLPVVAVRLFDVYGDGLPMDGPYAAPVKQLLRQLPDSGDLVIRGGHDECMDLLHVNDAVDFLISAMDHAYSAPPVINACTGRGVTPGDFADAVRVPGRSVISQTNGKGTWGSPRIGDPGNAERYLNTKATVGLVAGLEKLLENHGSLAPDCI